MVAADGLAAHQAASPGSGLGEEDARAECPQLGDLVAACQGGILEIGVPRIPLWEETRRDGRSRPSQ
jgi:hypothetical protein